MLAFCGQEKCLIDANGRLKMSPRFLSDFIERDKGNVVLHCLPEGALAVYPSTVYTQMRKAEPRPAEKAVSSMVFRRSLRYSGAMSQSQKISEQGRITLPVMFRDHTELLPGSEAIVIGVEIGIEIWSINRWKEELEKINSHNREKGDREMAADLMGGENK